MKRIMTAAVAAVCLGAAAPAGAGWLIEYRNTAVKPNGDRRPSIQSTTRIADGKLRSDQDPMIMVSDVAGDKFTVMNKERQLFWSGTTAEYERQTTGRKLEKLSGKFKSFKGKKELPPVDEEKLPRIVIRKTDQKREIAGHKAVKYVVESNAELFQELWIAEGIDISADLSVEQQLTQQRKLHAGMVGKSAGPFNALYRNEEYKKLLEKSFVMEQVTHHGAGKFERTVTALRQTEIAPEEFAVPESYKRVRLADVFPQNKEEARAETR